MVDAQPASDNPAKPAAPVRKLRRDNVAMVMVEGS
jgi:hypothetical protein